MSIANLQLLRLHTVKPLACLLTALALALTSACSSLPTNYEKIPSEAIRDTADSRLGKSVEPRVSSHPGLSGFYPLASGMEAFVARVGLIASADQTLDIQYYIWHSDTTGLLLIDQLIKAADRGVRVRLLLDDLDTAGKDRGLMLLDAHENIEIRLYNPFSRRSSRAWGFATDLKRVNRRMHNKSLTADNQMTIVGGRNIGNEYFGAISDTGFSDMDVGAIGPIVNDVSTMFDQYWNSEWVYPLAAVANEEVITESAMKAAIEEFSAKIETEMANPYVLAIQRLNYMERLTLGKTTFSWGKAVLIHDAPAKVTATEVTPGTHLAPSLAKYVQEASEEVLIISPYFVPGDRLVDFLGDLVDKGIRVRILTNSLAANDVGLVHAGYMRYRKPLLKKGVELYEFKANPAFSKKDKESFTGSSGASLHAKTFGLDQAYLFVGSFNLDPRSISLNTEMGVLFESPELGKALADAFDQVAADKAYRVELSANSRGEEGKGGLRWTSREDGELVILNKEPDTNWWQRFSVGFLSIIVPESML